MQSNLIYFSAYKFTKLGRFYRDLKLDYLEQEGRLKGKAIYRQGRKTNESGLWNLSKKRRNKKRVWRFGYTVV